MSPLLKNLLIALGIVMVIGCIYVFVLPSDPPLDGTEPISESDAVRQTAHILADTKKIDEFKVGGELLKKPAFQSLKENNIQAELTDTGTGRTNPFEDVQ